MAKGFDSGFGVHHWTAEAIGRHPDFPRARATYVARILELYGDDPFLNKLLMEAARIVIFALAICLEAGWRHEDRSTWPTVGALKKAVAVFGLASPRRVEQVVARLVQTGYLESRVSSLDGRVRLLIPSSRMIAHDQSWLTAHYAPLAALFGEADYRQVLAGDTAFQRAQRRVAMSCLHRSAQVLAGNPDVMLFLGRDAGILVLIQLVQQTITAGQPTVALSLEGLGRRFAVSRTHVRQLLAEAERRGLVRLHAARREITLQPALLASFDRFVAESMANHDLTGAAARRDLGV